MKGKKKRIVHLTWLLLKLFLVETETGEEDCVKR